MVARITLRDPAAPWIGDGAGAVRAGLSSIPARPAPSPPRDTIRPGATYLGAALPAATRKRLEFAGNLPYLEIRWEETTFKAQDS